MSGVGISLGFDRIYLLMDELDLFPEFLSITTQVLIANFGTETEQTCMDLLKKLRSKEIRSEFYPDFIRINNQLSYADKKNIPYVIMIGKNELESKVFLLKDLKKREQSSHSINEILSVINKKIG
jgi:histidyl-tRNA synthetase